MFGVGNVRRLEDKIILLRSEMITYIVFHCTFSLSHA